MRRMTDKEKGKMFDTLHDPNRPLFQLGHARRGNSSEDYESSAIRKAGERLLKRSMKTAHGVLAAFTSRAKKER